MTKAHHFVLFPHAHKRYATIVILLHLSYHNPFFRVHSFLDTYHGIAVTQKTTIEPNPTSSYFLLQVTKNGSKLQTNTCICAYAHI